MKNYYHRILIGTLLCSVFITAIFLYSYANIVFALLGFFLVLVGTFFRHFNLFGATEKKNIGKEVSNPFISIHIPAYKEPVETLRQTIEAAVSQDYENFEVLVIYNNTVDEKYWRPIERICQKYPNVKFLNFKTVKNYKAGALNRALNYISDQTDYILTVDADYILAQDALQIAVCDIDREQVALLQYPQAYYNLSTSNSVSLDFKHYFDFYAERASERNMNLPTGTLTLVNLKALRTIGNWPTHSITEDAQLGLELLNAGYKIGFKNKEIGKGVAPLNPQDLTTQRKRWIFGNVQNIFSLFTKKGIRPLDKINLLGQLTSWINFLLIPYSVLIVTALSAYIIGAHQFSEISVLLSLMAIFISHASKFLVFVKASKDAELGFSGFLAHCGLSYHSTVYWVSYFFNPIKPFIRTSKLCLEGSYCTANFIIAIPLLFTCFFLFNTIGVGYSILVFVHALFLLYANHRMNTDLNQDFKKYNNLNPIVQ